MHVKFIGPCQGKAEARKASGRRVHSVVNIRAADMVCLSIHVGPHGMSDLLPCIVTPCPIWVHRHGPPCRVDVNWWHQVRDYHEDETRLLKRRERFSEHVENTAWKSDYREITLSESGWIQVHGTRTLILFLRASPHRGIFIKS